MKLIDNWRQSWRFYSVRVLLALAGLPLIWAQVPPDVHALIPEAWRPYIIAFMAICAGIGRLIDQRGRTDG